MTVGGSRQLRVFPSLDDMLGELTKRRPFKTADLRLILVAPRRCRAGVHGSRGEEVTEHGDPPVADAEDLHK